jgi:hypothetical protein
VNVFCANDGHREVSSLRVTDMWWCIVIVRNPSVPDSAHFLALKGFYKLQTPSVWASGRDCSISTATRYGVDGPEIESRWGRDFPSRLGLRPTQPSTQWVPSLFPGG